MDNKEVSGVSILRSAGVMGVATFMSRILGLVREQVIGIFFGAGHATDAYLIAFRIPNLLRDLFAEGAMSASVVPTFTEERTLHGDRRAWRVAGTIFRVLLGIVTILTILGMVFSDALVSVYASAYREVPGKYELTVFLTRMIFPFFPMVCLAAAFMGVLNACGYFFIPAFASAVFNFVSILVSLSGLALIHYFNLKVEPITAVAVGVVLGGLAQSLCQVPSLREAGYRFPALQAGDPVWYKDPALKKILWLMLPSTVGLAATQVNILVNSFLATSIASEKGGAVSHLNFAFRLMQFPIGVFGVSLASAVLPRVSRLWVERDFISVAKTLRQSLRTVFAINLAATAGLAFLAGPIIQMIFEYRRFSPEATAETAGALLFYSVGLTAYSGVKVLVPACYAMGNTRLPVFSSILAVLITIALNMALVGPLGVRGLALGTSLAAIANLIFMLWVVRKLLKEKAQTDFELVTLLKPLFSYLSLALAMGALAFWVHAFLGTVLPDSAFPGFVAIVRVVKMSAVIGVSVGFWVGAGSLFGLPEVREAVQMVSRRLKKI